MRIIAGTWRGRALTNVGKGDPGAHLRPTTDRVRESLFNMLAGGRFGDPFEGAHVLDLFAGTGALGLEALSRAAVSAVFVDDGRKAQSLIKENLKLLRCETGRVITRDATRLPLCDTDPATLVFLDPPYGKGLGDKALAAAVKAGWLAEGALIVWEENVPQLAPEGFTRLDARRYGDTHVTVLRFGKMADL
ncbi:MULTISPECIES: 16S rRNA (guanine(966)-N(2))-methyltransferase RsmD [Marivita]|uniref:16S rRNA (Guanine(966)-N(2))-methyltransferase RsmD n=1 Tax=Marivita cryptomonadis TaxID=505252 RepID=A0A9Q2NV95_9RHOB|nr:MULTISPECIES: 16S rRNA (guanine(966)-N(2))-methyltransferase RsmD [Marivita]MCR9169432.1 16S rRNA (guanine(966)-N(2))-methyltransferase RsmD [Paracoccaceae bacterium]MBM2321698.1 16S rRNA (guanine(966)-N(2))-methyltransferase RsmD [Marivita cryptomonadis]MBM2331279.1 16S rRNA (guanine(966)-N(2))-methyltransferase RsmD [Marivita cryptomonadis]MBM2340865.1 16S rRNA (guanine(966)-N(2))-methyltransferase RsmD [Marivita cryptomonadis]MBM2345527.1 16S rRNA (guanine(966)-N(2))-methyltransferase Rs